MTFRAAIVGFGRIAAGYVDDPAIARTYRYISHVQVLADHPDFTCVAAVDPLSDARVRAANRWNIPSTAADVAELPNADAIEVAVIATPPANQLAVIDALPSLKAVIVEKPIGASRLEAARFLAACHRRNILVQVNFWRRADQAFRELANGQLRQHIGVPQAAVVVYGNGVRNNAIHMIDVMAMLLGPFVRVQAVGGPVFRLANSLSNDPDISFVATTAEGVPVTFLPVDFACYRENAIDIWGTHGRFEALVEGLVMRTTARRPHRGDSTAAEVSADDPTFIATTAGHALWNMYDNLSASLKGQAQLFSPGERALHAQEAIDAVLRSGAGGYVPIDLDVAA